VKASAISTLMKASSKAAKRLSTSPDKGTRRKYRKAVSNVFPAAQAALKTLKRK
jgi:hypothetical protein